MKKRRMNIRGKQRRKEKSQRRKENNYTEGLKNIGRNTISKELKK